MDNAGSGVSPLFAAGCWRPRCLCATFSCRAIVPAVLCPRAGPGYSRSARRTRQQGAPRFDWRLTDLPVSLWRYLLAVALFSLVTCRTCSCCCVRVSWVCPPPHIPLLWAAVSAVAMFFPPALSAWSDRVGRVRLLVGATWRMPCSMRPWGGCRRGLGLVCVVRFLWAVHGGHGGLKKPWWQTWSRQGAEGRHLVGSTSPPVCFLPASLVFGALYEGLSPAVAFCFSAACAAGAAVLLTWLPEPQRYPHHEVVPVCGEVGLPGFPGCRAGGLRFCGLPVPAGLGHANTRSPSGAGLGLRCWALRWAGRIGALAVRWKPATICSLTRFA